MDIFSGKFVDEGCDHQARISGKKRFCTDSWQPLFLPGEENRRVEPDFALGEQLITHTRDSILDVEDCAHPPKIMKAARFHNRAVSAGYK